MAHGKRPFLAVPLCGHLEVRQAPEGEEDEKAKVKDHDQEQKSTVPY